MSQTLSFVLKTHNVKKDFVHSVKLTLARRRELQYSLNKLSRQIRLEACPSCASYDVCPNCTSGSIPDDGSSINMIPSWEDVTKTSTYSLLLSEDTSDELCPDDLVNVAAHIRKALSTQSHPANGEMCKEQLTSLLVMAEAMLPQRSRSSIPLYQQYHTARLEWREKFFHKPLDFLLEKIGMSKDILQVTAIWKIILEKACYCKSYGEQWFNVAKDKLREFKTFEGNTLKPLIGGFIDGLRFMTVDNPNPLGFLPKLIGMIKPLNLAMIIDNHENTLSGWVITLTAIMELYNITECTIDVITAVVTAFYDKITNASKFYSSVKALFTGFRTEDVSNSFWYMAAAILCYLITGLIPNNGRFSKIKACLSGASTLVSGIIATQKLAAMFATWNSESIVNELSARTVALSELNNPTTTSDTDSVERLLELAKILHEEIKVHTLNPIMQSYNPILRNLMSTLDGVISSCNKRKAVAKKRPVPVCYILTGPPGCGKTTAAQALAKKLSDQEPSVINLDVDHHDTYTGNEVCIIDEFDSSDKVDYANFVIGMVNSAPMILNCDMLENKGKLFTSKYIIMTSNSETPVKPSSRRAGAFYRRVTIIDVTNPLVESHKRARPGTSVPRSCYKKNFSHLSLAKRGAECWCKEYVLDPKGLQHQSIKAPTPTFLNIDSLAQTMKQDFALKNMAFEAEEGCSDHRYGFVCQQNEVETVRRLLNAVRARLNATFTVCVGPEASNSVGCTAHVLTPDEPFNGKKFIVSRCNEASLSVLEGNCVQSALGVCMSDKDLTHLCHFIKGKIVNDSVRLDELPANQHVVTVNSVFDLAWALRRHLTLAGQFQAIRAAYDVLTVPDKIPAMLRHWMDETSFSDEHVVTQFITPGGIVILESCGGARIWALGHNVIRAGGVTATPIGGCVRLMGLSAHTMPWSEIFRELFALLGKIWSNIKVSTLVLTALGMYASRFRPKTEAKGKTKKKIGPYRGRGVALTDDEYDEWREHNATRKLDLSVEDFLMLRHRAALGADDADAVKFRSWWNSRSKFGDDYEDVTVIGRGGVKHEKIRTNTLKAVDRGYDISFAEESGPGTKFHKNAIGSVTDICGEHKGYCVHMGHGVYASVAHVVKGDSFFLGERIFDLKTNGEFCCFRSTKILPSAAPFFSGKPTRDPWGSPVATDWKPKPYTTTSGKIIGCFATTSTETHPGDCGLPYIDDNGRVTGLHTGSGGPKTPSAKLVVPYVHIDMKTKSVTTQKYDVTKPDISYKGLICKQLDEIRIIPKGTRLHVSPAHTEDFDECSHQPASLGSGDPRCPKSLTAIVVDSLKPYCDKVEGPPHDVLHRVQKMLIDHLSGFVPMNISSETSMIAAFHKLNHDTSCGPYLGGRKKDHMTNGEPDKQLLDLLSSKWKLATQGIALPHEYTIGLKDELRPIEKIQEGKRRMIWGCDVGVATVCAAAFKGVSDAITANHQYGPVQVGINMDSPSVEALYQRIKSAAKVFAVDYSKWDSTQSPRVSAASIDILRYFSDRSPVVDSAVNTLKSPPIAIFNGVAVKVSSGLPSGMPLTSVINSLNHCLYVACAILQSLEARNIPVTWNLFSSFDMMTYGDDGVYMFPTMFASVSDQIFGNLTAYGLKPTRVDKSVGAIEPIDPESVVFLKRTITRTPHGIRGLLDRSSIIRQFYYIKGENSDDWKTPPKSIDPTSRGQQLWNACLYASQHGIEFYAKVYKLAERAVEYEGLHLEPPTYYSALEHYNSQFNGVEARFDQIDTSDMTALHCDVFEV
nr:nonstructural protein [Feline calicivirus]